MAKSFVTRLNQSRFDFAISPNRSVATVRGATIFKGSVWQEAEGETLRTAARQEAYGRLERAHNGVWMAWDKRCDPRVRAAYEQLVLEEMERSQRRDADALQAALIREQRKMRD